MFEIEKEVPVTSKGIGSGRKLKYPFDKMEIGDSFAFPIKIRSSVIAASCMWGKKNGNVKFVSRKIDSETCRIWRTA